MWKKEKYAKKEEKEQKWLTVRLRATKECMQADLKFGLYMNFKYIISSKYLFSSIFLLIIFLAEIIFFNISSKSPC